MKRGRNDPCPCGSGKKYKKCCGPADEESRHSEDSTSEGNVQSLLQEALQLHQQGHLTEAAPLYLRILEKDPSNADAMHLLGLVSHARGEYEKAEQYIRKAILQDDKAAFFYLNLGNALKAQGKTDETIEQYRNAIMLEPNLAEAHYNLANELQLIGNPEDAIASYKTAISLNPRFAEAYYNQGNALENLRRFDEAIESLENAVSINPDYAEAHNVLGRVFAGLRMFEQAEGQYREVLRVVPDHVEACFELADMLRKQEKSEEAEYYFRLALEIKPDFADALNNLAIVLRQQGRIDEAIMSYMRALEIEPSAATFSNLAGVFQEDGQIDKAIESCEKALMMEPDYAEAHWNLSLALLYSGDLSRGWREYEWRFFKVDPVYRPFPELSWDGSGLQDKTILIYSEQGIGDQIMFASMINEIVERSGRCIVECVSRLVPLFERSFPEAIVIPMVAKPEEFHSWGQAAIDVKVAMGSLPLFLRPDLASFPVRQAYLFPDSQKAADWRRRLSALGYGPKVGVSWRGGKERSVQTMRSTTLDQWSEILSIPGLHFVDVQYGDTTRELQNAKDELSASIHHWGDVDAMEDMDGFAALISALDLIISVDNSTVHLAGALGVPAWVLLPKGSDWRWMKDVEDTPWYSSVRLFRQRRHGIWDEVFTEVAAELKRAGVPDKIGWTGAGPLSFRSQESFLSRNIETASFVDASEEAVAERERQKYRKAWSMNDREYAHYSPGLRFSESLNFLEYFKTHDVKSILDAGIGSGKLCRKMLDMGFDCHGVDIADNCLDAELLHLKDKILTIGTLWDGSLFAEGRFDAVICIDVMEHIHTKYVDRIIDNLYRWTRKYVFLQIALFHDYFGRQIAEDLHLTVQPKTWWDERVKKFRIVQDLTLKDQSDADVYAVYMLEKV